MRNLKALIFFLSDSIILLFLKLLFIPKTTKNTIGFIKVDSIGDFFVFLWFLNIYFKEIYGKDKNLILFCNENVKLLAESLGYFDEIISIDVKRFKYNIIYRGKFIYRLRKISFDKIINPTFSNFFLTGHSLVRFCRSKNKVGFLGDYINSNKYESKIASHWYSHQIILPSITLVNEFILYRHLIEYLKLNIPDEPIITLPQKIGVNPISREIQNYFVLFPGASDKYRIWPIYKYTQLLDWLINKYNLTAVICGSKSEEILSESLINSISKKSQVINMVGKTPLDSLVEIIRDSIFLIGNETSGIHIASAVNTPSFCILGGGHFNRFTPYPENSTLTRPLCIFKKMDCFNCDWRCPYLRESDKSYPCIEKIDINDLMSVIDTYLISKNLQ